MDRTSETRTRADENPKVLHFLGEEKASVYAEDGKTLVLALVPVDLESEDPAADARAELPELACFLRALAGRLGKRRRGLPLPDSETLTAVYESGEFEGFPAVALTMDLEGLEGGLVDLADRAERIAHGQAPGRPGNEVA